MTSKIPTAAPNENRAVRLIFVLNMNEKLICTLYRKYESRI
jgi:hypothetical protein